MSSKSAHPNITETKQTFLRTQIRLLSTPLTLPAPSSNTTNNTTLPESATEDLLSKLNQKIRAHNRLVFSAPSQRHVAEQIESLIWGEVVSSTDTGAGAGKGGDGSGEAVLFLGRDVDLTDPGVLSGLPDSIAGLGRSGSNREGRRRGKGREGGESAGDGGEGEREREEERDEEEKRYEDALNRARELLRRREELKRTVQACRGLRGLLEPFGDVQPNLVTRDGELAKEVERMRVLVARVEGGLAQAQTSTRQGDDDGNDTNMQMEMEERGVSDQQKLAGVLELG